MTAKKKKHNIPRKQFLLNETNKWGLPFLFVLEISERPSRRSTSSTFRHQGVEHDSEVNNEIKDEDKDTAATCTLLMLFE